MAGDNDDLLGAEKRKCVRYTQEGSRVIETREHDVVGMWERFNKDFRPHSALFVDGTCTHLGALTKDQCIRIEAELKATNVAAETRSDAKLLLSAE